MSKKTAVLICPGRGTYNKTELGTLGATHAGHPLIAKWDALRRETGQETLTDLDGADRFQPRRHTTGDNASALIYACSYLDALVAYESHDIRAVTGNSLGWYIALAAGGAVDPEDGMRIVNTMGTLMHREGVGGQILYPFVDEDWREIPGARDDLLTLVAQINARAGHRLAPSIHLGGMLVVGGDDAGLAAFEAALPKRDDRYPLRLPHHAAFHTDLLGHVARKGRMALPARLFGQPETAMIDGRGGVWAPLSSDLAALHAYTLGQQVTEAYDFTKAVQTAARSFAPERFIITGPGTTLGSAVAQALIAIKWQGIDSKAAFVDRQGKDPVVISMGRRDQRDLVAQG